MALLNIMMMFIIISMDGTIFINSDEDQNIDDKNVSCSIGDVIPIYAEDRKFKLFDSPEEKEWTEPFYFIQGADIQFGMEERTQPNITDRGVMPEIAWASQMVVDIRKMDPPPKFVAITGDLVDTYPDWPPEERIEEIQTFKFVYGKLKLPLVLVSGNHDIGNQPTPESVSTYRSTFGDDYYSFWYGGVFFIVLSSQVYKNATFVPEMYEEHEAWLEEQLESIQEENPKHVIVLQHIPYFIKEPSEEKMRYNVEKDLRMELLDRLYDSGVRYIFTGHYHRNAGGFHKDMELVVTSAIGKQKGDDKSGYRIVKVYEDKVEHQYYALGEAPINIDL